MTVLDVTGDDAASFLQGQLTCDVNRLEATAHSLGAWCNPKGRVIVLFRIRKLDDGFELLLPQDLAESTVKRLTMFRFRAKVDFATRDAVAADFGDEVQSFETWQAQNLRNGVASIAAAQSEKFTPHMLNLDLLDAISLDKGCYTGQEVVARTHYKGATRRRLMRFESGSDAAPGDKIQLDGRDVGEVVNVDGGELLAVVPVDSATAGLELNAASLKHLPLPYLDRDA